jgi:hypothetical protein
MKPRHFLARIAAVVTAAAAVAMFLGPVRAGASDHDDPDGTAHRDSTPSMAESHPESLLDGWANRDFDIGALNSAMAEELGSRLDGWEHPEVDLSSDMWEATAFGIGSILDGWGNRDMDIGAFAAGTWDKANTVNGGEVLGSDW